VNKNQYYEKLKLNILKSIILNWAESKPVYRVTLYLNQEPAPPYILTAELPALPQGKARQRSKLRFEYRNKEKEKNPQIHPRDIEYPPDLYPPELEYSENEDAVIEAYESTSEDCLHLRDWLPDVYKGDVPLEYRDQWIWLNIEPGEVLDVTLVREDTRCVLYGPEFTTKSKMPSRSSNDREHAITLAKLYIEQHQIKKKKYTCAEAAAYIQRKLSKEWPLRTIKNWIKPYFPDETRQPGRPKKKK